MPGFENSNDKESNCHNPAAEVEVLHSQIQREEENLPCDRCAEHQLDIKG